MEFEDLSTFSCVDVLKRLKKITYKYKCNCLEETINAEGYDGEKKICFMSFTTNETDNRIYYIKIYGKQYSISSYTICYKTLDVARLYNGEFYQKTFSLEKNEIEFINRFLKMMHKRLFGM